MDPTITPAPHEAASAALAAAEDLASLAEDRCPHADVLSRTLSLVSQDYSAPVPSCAAAAIQKALTDVADLLQRHQLDVINDNDDDNGDDRRIVAYTLAQRTVIERGLRLLWTHVTTYQLHAALIDMMRTIDFLPRALVFWKHLRKSTVREIVQRGPMQWILTRAQQITAGERIRSLEETLDAHLRKTRMLKNLTMKCTVLTADSEQLETRVNEGMAPVTCSSRNATTCQLPQAFLVNKFGKWSRRSLNSFVIQSTFCHMRHGGLASATTSQEPSTNTLRELGSILRSAHHCMEQKVPAS